MGGVKVGGGVGLDWVDWVGIDLDGIVENWIRRDRIGWGEVGWDRMGFDRIGSDCIVLDGVAWMGWDGIEGRGEVWCGIW